MERNNDFNLDVLKEYVARLQAEKNDILSREQSLQGELGPVFDSDGIYNPERARQEYQVQIDMDKKELMEREQELMQIVGPIFSNGLSNSFQNQQQEQYASMVVEQMADPVYQANEMDLPGDIIR